MLTWLFAPALRRHTLLAGWASLALNLTLLVPALYMLQIFDRVFSSRSEETLAMLTLAAAAGLMLMYFMDSTRAAALAWAGRVLDARLGPRALDNLLLDAARFGPAHNLNLSRDAGLLRGFVGGQGIHALFDAPWVPIYLLVIFLFHPLLGAAATAGALLLAAAAWLNERATRQPTAALLQDTRRAAHFIDAATRNADAVVGMGMAPGVVAQWQALNQQVAAAQERLGRVSITLGAAVRSLRHGMQVVMLALGAWLVIDQHVTPGVMIAATILLARALYPVEQLITGWKAIADARGAWRRLAQQADAAAVTSDFILPEPRGRLKLERVVYAPQPQQPPTLRGVSLELQPGEALGIIGPSGSGKTTLARLILGIWTPLAGTVRLDGADVAGWERTHLGRHVGYLPQDVELFDGTVAENIARLGAVDSAAVLRAAQLAHAHDFILRLPEGYDTRIGEGGARLSAGQRQRLGLARAVYGEPRLVVLDEPYANLDSEGEQALARTLAALKANGCTLILIGHRPSLMRHMDKLAVLREGQLEAFGPAAQLLPKYVPARRSLGLVEQR